jgi:hypothetical protein
MNAGCPVFLDELLATLRHAILPSYAGDMQSQPNSLSAPR